MISRSDTAQNLSVFCMCLPQRYQFDTTSPLLETRARIMRTHTRARDIRTDYTKQACFWEPSIPKTDCRQVPTITTRTQDRMKKTPGQNFPGEYAANK